MSTNFPTALDSLTNPTGGQTLGAGGHAAQHCAANDAIEALEAKVGVTDSTDPESLDYRIKALEQSGSAGGDMTKAAYDSDNDGKVDAAEVADTVQWAGVQNPPATYPPSAHNHDTAYEPLATAGATTQYRRGDKTWADFATDVRASVLTGLSTATNAAISATDTVLAAIGKLQAQITGHVGSTSNPHSVTKSQVGLGNVDNTSDLSKPISTATQTALNGKAAASHVPFEWVVADATARAALTPSAIDVYKQCFQLSDYTIWTLSSVSPVTWRSAGSDSTAIRVAGAVGLWKTDSSTPAFVKTGAGTISVKADVFVVVAGVPVYFSAQTAIIMPTLTAGTDYAIYVCTDGTIRADASWTYPSGYSAATSLKVGGFHYAPGGNAAAQAGGDATPAINEYSIWDLKFRPACPDPRGMTLVADSFWSDIYLLGVDHLTNGTSKYNVTIADGSSPPKIPTKFGGNGSTAYSTLNWWEANEVLQSWGKRSPTYDEFAALAYGTTEASSVGTDQGSTILNAAYTSKWGCIQSTGVMWIWGAEFGGGAAGTSWTANTGGWGSTYQMENAVLFGGSWGSTSDAGSRASYWSASPTLSNNFIGARGVCGHYVSD